MIYTKRSKSSHLLIQSPRTFIPFCAISLQAASKALLTWTENENTMEFSQNGMEILGIQ